MMPSKNPIIIATGIVALLLIVIIFFGTRSKPDDTIIACTMEAKLCPDGSAVGRIGPNCEFAKCPEVKLQITSFEECAAAGYPIMESYPEQCKTPDGKTFVKSYANQKSGIEGIVLLGPVCPVMKDPPL